jgi:hypothetical protein
MIFSDQVKIQRESEFSLVTKGSDQFFKIPLLRQIKIVKVMFNIVIVLYVPAMAIKAISRATIVTANSIIKLPRMREMQCGQIDCHRRSAGGTGEP